MGSRRLNSPKSYILGGIVESRIEPASCAVVRLLGGEYRGTWGDGIVGDDTFSSLGGQESFAGF